jgi:long-chain acyl-CoA synthetase
VRRLLTLTNLPVTMGSTNAGTVAWPLRRAMSIHHDREAIVDGETRLTYAQWGTQCLGLGAGLRSLGLGNLGVVGLAALNGWRHLTCWLGVPSAGLVLNDLNYRLAPAELAFIVNDCGATAIIVDDAHIALAHSLTAQCPTLQHFIYAGDGETPAGFLSFDELCNTQPLDDSVTEFISTDTLAAIGYTGGTTGLPKGVMQSHGNLINNAKHMQYAYGYTCEDSYLHAAPMFHAADASCTFALTWTGARHLMIPGWDPQRFCQLAAAESMTITLLVPTMINMLANYPDLDNHDLSSWRLLGYGASPMPAELQRLAMAKLPCGFMQLYGMTDAFAHHLLC